MLFAKFLYFVCGFCEQRRQTTVDQWPKHEFVFLGDSRKSFVFGAQSIDNVIINVHAVHSPLQVMPFAVNSASS